MKVIFHHEYNFYILSKINYLIVLKHVWCDSTLSCRYKSTFEILLFIIECRFLGNSGSLFVFREWKCVIKISNKYSSLTANLVYGQNSSLADPKFVTHILIMKTSNFICVKFYRKKTHEKMNPKRKHMFLYVSRNMFHSMMFHCLKIYKAT
jgi:hypothetical protein